MIKRGDKITLTTKELDLILRDPEAINREIKYANECFAKAVVDLIVKEARVAKNTEVAAEAFIRQICRKILTDNGVDFRTMDLWI